MHQRRASDARTGAAGAGRMMSGRYAASEPSLSKAVNVNPEIAGCGLWCNSIFAKLNVIDDDLRKRLSDELRFLGIQLQMARGHPLVNLFNAGSNFINHPNGYSGLVENVDLSIISTAMDTESMLIGN